jgi:hypothetical protein
LAETSTNDGFYQNYLTKKKLLISPLTQQNFIALSALDAFRSQVTWSCAHILLGNFTVLKEEKPFEAIVGKE